MTPERVPQLTEAVVPPLVLGPAALTHAAYAGASAEGVLGTADDFHARHDSGVAARLFDAGLVWQLAFRREDGLRLQAEALRDLGVAHAELVSQHGVMFMVRRIKVDYLEAARLDDSLIVTTRPLVVGAASVELRQNIARLDAPGRVLASLDIRLACVRLADQRAVRIPTRWRDALQGMAEERDSAP